MFNGVNLISDLSEFIKGYKIYESVHNKIEKAEETQEENKSGNEGAQQIRSLDIIYV